MSCTHHVKVPFLLIIVLRVHSKEFWRWCITLGITRFLDCPSSGILKTREHNVSETGSISILRWRGETPIQFGPLERTNLNQCSLVFRIPDDGQVQKPSNSEHCTTIFHRLTFIFLHYKYLFILRFFSKPLADLFQDYSGAKFITFLAALPNFFPHFSASIASIFKSY
jgi:hypothetical protein